MLECSSTTFTARSTSEVSQARPVAITKSSELGSWLISKPDRRDRHSDLNHYTYPREDQNEDFQNDIMSNDQIDKNLISESKKKIRINPLSDTNSEALNRIIDK